MREGLHNEVILSIFLLFVSIFLLMLLTGCEIRENAVIREQTDIFTDEIEAVVEGELINTTFIANKLFAKCPTKYEDEAYEESKVSFVK